MVTDARFLLQWAGPKYIYPLDIFQLKETLNKTIGEQPSFKVFKAINSVTIEPVGHIQLMNIDYSNGTCVLGRVLIFPDHRFKGFGKAIVRLALKEAFDSLGLQEVKLNVFDFNKNAIALYNSIGFISYQVKKGARNFQSETWNLVSMKLSKDKWLQRKKC